MDTTTHPVPATTPTTAPSAEVPRANFICDIIDADLASGKHTTVITRFPPEPNGYLHIGHAKSICLNFGLAKRYGGRCHMRFDDTNPSTEDVEYVDSIQNDIKWLGFDWGEHLYFASDYFGKMYEYAVHLIKTGKAYVCALSKDEFKDYRGTIYEPGKPSPYRDRPVEENLRLFEEMRAGKHPEGSLVLRGKIDMGSPNMLMRDPPLYRIRFAPHHRTGTTWPIYPMYDYAHCLEDAQEHITHSICTLEFETNRALYDWVLDHVPAPAHPQQIEFARLSLGFTVMSKRKLLQLVNEHIVSGWDDPRMPTLAGLRRRGVTPEAIRTFCDMIGVAKANSTVDIEKFEFCIREDLNSRAPRVMAVLKPLKVVITNYPEDQTEQLDVPLWPHDVPKEGARKVPFSREVFIDRDDFREDPPSKWHRLAPGAEVRLRYAYFVRCDAVVRDPNTHEITELHCTYDPATRGGDAPDGRKVRGTLHWVCAKAAVAVEVRLYDRLFTVERPDADPERDFKAFMNPDSLVTLPSALVEPYVIGAASPGSHFQFERTGYFFTDPVSSRDGKPVFNRVVGLRDSWAKIEAAEAPSAASTPAPSRERAKKADSAPAPKPRSTERDAARAEAPVLAERYARYQASLGLGEEAADLLTGDAALCDFFEAACAIHPQAVSVANWVINDLQRETKGRTLNDVPVTPAKLAALVALVDAGRITLAAAREVFGEMARSGADPEAVVKARGLESISDADALSKLIDAVLAEHAAETQRYKAGEKQLQGFLMGQVMKAAKGKGDPKQLRPLLMARLDG